MYKKTDGSLFYIKLLGKYKIANSQNIALDIKPWKVDRKQKEYCDVCSTFILLHK